MRHTRRGKKDRRIALYTRTGVPNTDFGGDTSYTETLFATYWAEYKPYSRQMEDYEGGAPRAQRTDVFEIDYRTGITVEMILVCNGIRYNIRSTSQPPGSRNQQLLIFAEVQE